MNTTLQPSTFAGFKGLCTGSKALDRLFGDAGTLAPQMPSVLHVFGGSETLQRRFLLALCQGALSGGERAVFIDLGGDFDSHSVREAGLYGAFNPANPSDPDSHFRMLGPCELNGGDVGTPYEQNAAVFPALRKTIRGLTESSPYPVVVVINGVQSALFDYLNAQALNTPDERRLWQTLEVRAQGAVMRELLNARLDARRGNFALWFAHSPKVKRTRSDSPNAFAGAFASAVKGTMKKECRGGLELVGESLGTGGDSLIIAAKARDFHGNVAKEGAFELWINGGSGFRNYQG